MAEEAALSRREMIEAAFDAEENKETPDAGLPDEEVASEETSQHEEPEDTSGSGEGEEVERAEARAAEEDGEPEKVTGKLIPKDERAGKDPTITDAEAQQRVGAPPVSWKGDAKSEWAKLPEPVRREVAKREAETSRALSYSADARKFANDFYETIKPFESLITARGSTPLKAVQNLMQTAAILQTGNAQQRAQTAMEIILGYGIDVRILDDLLAEAQKNPGRFQQQPQIPPQLMPALKPVFDAAKRLEERERRDAEMLQTRAVETIEAMRADSKKYPFLDDVRESMADIMEVAGARGKFYTLDQAYTMAVRMDPKLFQASQQRQKGTEVSRAARTLAQARARRSATTGAPSGTTKALPAPKNRREAIEQAWENSSKSVN